MKVRSVLINALIALPVTVLALLIPRTRAILIEVFTHPLRAAILKPNNQIEISCAEKTSSAQEYNPLPAQSRDILP